MAFVALLDTSVLFPMYLRDVLLTTAEHGHYRLVWSSDILNELERALVDQGRLESARAHGLIRIMEEAFPEASVEGYDHLTVETHDIEDRHVLAAAIKGKVDVLVTANIRDFLENTEERYAIGVMTPDEFLTELCEEAGGTMRQLLGDRVAEYTNPPMTVDDLLERLGLPTFADCVRSGPY